MLGVVVFGVVLSVLALYLLGAVCVVFVVLYIVVLGVVVLSVAVLEECWEACWMRSRWARILMAGPILKEEWMWCACNINNPLPSMPCVLKTAACAGYPAVTK